MAQFGKLEEFRPENEPCTAYIEHLEQYMEANDVEQDKHVAFFAKCDGGNHVRTFKKPGTAGKAEREDIWPDSGHLERTLWTEADISCWTFPF